MTYDQMVHTLRLARVMNRRTQENIAARAGFKTRTSISHYERHGGEPRASNLVAWAGALGYDVQLVRRGPNPSADETASGTEIAAIKRAEDQ